MKKFVILALAVSLPVAAQDMATEVKATEAGPGIYMLEGANGWSSNMGLMIGDEHVLLIDNGMPMISDGLLRKVQEMAGRPADFVVNTHAHGDHVGSNAALVAAGAVIFAHHDLRDALVDNVEYAGGPTGLPMVTFSDEVTFHVNGHRTEVLHVPAAHTSGDAIIHFPEQNVIDAGDVFFNGMFPFIDLDGGGTVDGYQAAQQLIMDLADDDTVIIPGHGPLATRADLREAVNVLADAEGRVKRMVEAGMTQEEVLEANPLADYHDKWNWFFITTEKMTITLYRSLTDG